MSEQQEGGALSAPPAPAGDVDFSEFALDLLTGKEAFTDLHVESNQPAMIRRSASAWTEALNADGKPMVIPHHRIIEFLNGVFAPPESRAPGAKAAGDGAWKRELHERGSLHPAINLVRPTPSGETMCRVRCTVQKQMMGEAIGLVLRPLRSIPESLEALGLPVQASGMLKSSQRGLVVVTGPTGAGKSTTLAAMINEINASKRANILTIEDPVEFEHPRKKSIINQRELGIDVATYEAGVRDALRFVPDVILIGEIRDAGTMTAALRAAVSGHLVLTTTHAPTTVDAIRKMISYLDGSQADCQSLASCLVAVIAQALVPDAKGSNGNHLAFEFLNCRDSKVSDVVGGSGGDTGGAKLTGLQNQVRKDELSGIATSMKQSLKSLVDAGKVQPKDAAAVVIHPEDKEAFQNMQPISGGTLSPVGGEKRNWAGATGAFKRS